MAEKEAAQKQEWGRREKKEKEKENGKEMVAKALDGQRFPLPLCS